MAWLLSTQFYTAIQRRPVDGNRVLTVGVAFTVWTLAPLKIPRDRSRGESDEERHQRECLIVLPRWLLYARWSRSGQLRWLSRTIHLRRLSRPATRAPRLREALDR